jgi:hypothetical protein
MARSCPTMCSPPFSCCFSPFPCSLYGGLSRSRYEWLDSANRARGSSAVLWSSAQLATELLVRYPCSISASTSISTYPNIPRRHRRSQSHGINTQRHLTQRTSPSTASRPHKFNSEYDPQKGTAPKNTSPSPPTEHEDITRVRRTEDPYRPYCDANFTRDFEVKFWSGEEPEKHRGLIILTSKMPCQLHVS